MSRGARKGAGGDGAILRLVDVPSFLRMYPPFDDLGDERMEEVVRHAHIEFFPAGASILQESGTPARFLYVVRRGAVELLEGSDLVDVLGEGEVFGFVSLLSGTGPSFSARAHEDAICYLIDKEIAEDVMASRRGLMFLASAFRRRDQRALSDIDPEQVDHRQAPVARLVTRRPITMPATASIRQAAQVMADEREGYVLLEAEGASGLSIITDRDLRTRVLAEGRSPGSAATDAASSPVVTVAGEATLAEVTAIMLERGIHHIPVEDGDGGLLGVVTDVDLLAAEQHDAFALRRGIERAPDRSVAIEAFRSAPQVASRLVEASVDPLEVAHVLAVAVDALTLRLLDLGAHELGGPPCSWTWLALGGQARHEQGMLADQDHVLIFDTRGEESGAVDGYFDALGRFVNDGLEEAGVSGGGSRVIAGSADRRGGVEDLLRGVRASIAEPDPVGASVAATLIDYRPVAGPLDVRAALDEIIRSAREHPDFIRSLGARVVSPRPPRGLLRDGVVQGRTTTDALDIRQVGIDLIAGLARLVAVLSGLTENRTTRRLRDVATLGWLTTDECQGLEEAFRLMWQVRLEHHSRCVRLGLPVDDLVQPAMLGPLTRQALKESFRMIDRAQARLGTLAGVRR